MRLVISIAVLALAACGGSSSGGGTTQDLVAELTIHSGSITTQTGTTAASIQVPNPGSIRFTNGDTVAHTIVVPTGSSNDCNPLNVGTIQPGASTPTVIVNNSTSGNEICTFSDSANPALSGNITILTQATGGSGY
ncbi:MAG TPA: hypothetical protein VGH20_03755 [Myxococcales bacterium]